MTRGALHSHKMQSIPPLTSRWKNLVSPKIIIAKCNKLHFILKQYDAFYFARIEEVDTMFRKIFARGVRKEREIEQKTKFIRAAGDIERYKPHKTKGMCVT